MWFDKIGGNCQTSDMKESIADSRQQIILTAAWFAFAAYGYRKTSMDDIARGAAMSRPALYLHYRNKRDIFRSLARQYYEDAAAAIEASLAGSGSASEVLAAAFRAQGGEVIETMLSSPHGMELLDATNATAADTVMAGEERLRAIYAAWLARVGGAGRGRFTGSEQDMAGTMMAALKGIKMAGTDYATYQTRVALLAAMIGAGLEAE